MTSDKGNYLALRIRKPAYIELSQGARLKIAQKQLMPCRKAKIQSLDPLPGKYQRGDCVTSRIFAKGVTGKILGLANEHGVYHAMTSTGEHKVCHVDYMRPAVPIVREFKIVKPREDVIFIPGGQAATHPMAWGIPTKEDSVEERIRESNERMTANYREIYNRRRAAMGGS